MLERLFKSKAEAKVLGIVLFQDDLHLREISRQAGVSPHEAKRELDNLVEMSIITRQKKGNLVLFAADKSCPLIGDLRQLYLKTDGFAGLLKEAVEKLTGLKYGFIYGSAAKMQMKQNSDIDLMLIGKVNEDELLKKIMPLQDKVGREVNYVLWSEEDLEKKTKLNQSFFKSLKVNPKIWLFGDADEFKRIIAKA